MTSRRDFLGLLAATPFFAPVVAKELAAPKYASGGFVRGETFSASFGERVILSRFPGNIHNFKNLTPLSDGSFAIGEVYLHPSVHPLGETIPNRLYGAYIKDDGDAA